MSKLDDLKAQFLAQLDIIDTKLLKYPSVQLAQEKTNVRPAFIAVALGTVLGFLAMFQLGSHALCQIIGFFYPLYASYQAVKTPEVEDDGFWLTYWIIFSIFTLIESLTDILLNSFPFGLYWVSKVIFLIWCFLPQTKGAKLIYDRVVDPILRRYETRIDESVSRFDKGASRIAKDLRQDAADASRVAGGVMKRKVLESMMDNGGQRGSQTIPDDYVDAADADAAVPDAPHMHAQ